MRRDPLSSRRHLIRVLASGALLVPIVSHTFARGDPSPSTPSGPNILLIVTDDQRAAADTLLGHAEDARAVRGPGNELPQLHGDHAALLPVAIHDLQRSLRAQHRRLSRIRTQSPYRRSTSGRRSRPTCTRPDTRPGSPGSSSSTGRSGTTLRTSTDGPPSSGGYEDPVFNVDGTVRTLHGVLLEHPGRPVRGHLADVRIVRCDAVVPLRRPASAALSLHAGRAVSRRHRAAMEAGTCLQRAARR